MPKLENEIPTEEELRRYFLENLGLLRACEKIPARSEGASGRVWQGAGVPIAGSVASST